MSQDKHHENLSALMDGEASELDSRRLLRDADGDDAGRWSRWHLARDVMQGHDVTPAPGDFAARVCAGLDQHSRERSKAGWVAQLSRAGIAASVAMAMVLGWQYMGEADSGATPQLVQGDARMSRLFSGTELVGADFGSNAARPVGAAVPQQMAEPRIEHLMVRHSDFAARQGGQGPVPFVRFISMDANKDVR